MYSIDVFNSAMPVPYEAVVEALDFPMARVSVQAGFPSPADDFVVERLDVMKLLVRHPKYTYFWRARGDSMIGAGIQDGCLLAIDRTVRPRSGNIVVAVIDAECTCKYLYKRSNEFRLKAANPTYPDIIPKEGQSVVVWGVVHAGIMLFPS